MYAYPKERRVTASRQTRMDATGPIYMHRQPFFPLLLDDLQPAIAILPNAASR